MALTKSEKQAIISKYGVTGKNDTGSPEVQIAILTEEIKLLTSHLQKNKKDIHSRIGLYAKVSSRRSMLDYLKKTNEDRYANIIKSLGLRK